MRKDEFIIHAQVEDAHWWFSGRREILLSQIRSHRPEAKVIAEIGCGTGGNLKFLHDNGYRVIGTDIDPLAVDFARKRVRGDIYLGDYADTFTNEWENIDIIILADVLEHIEDDALFFRRMTELVHPGTLIIITVPSTPSLWSRHDEVLGHCRRYTSAKLKDLLSEGDHTKCLFISHFNTFLFPLIFMFRLIDRHRRPADIKENSHLNLPSRPVNGILNVIFTLEKFWLAKNWRFPFGVSQLAVLQKDR